MASTFFGLLAVLAPLAAAAPAAAILPTPYTLSFSGPTVVPEGGLLTFSASLVGGDCSPYSGVNWTTSATGTGVQPAEPGDYMNPSPPLIGFASGTGTTLQIQLQTITDADADDETVTVTLTAANPNLSCSGQPPAQSTYSVDILIVDAAPQPTVRFSSALATAVDEGNSGQSAVAVTIEMINAPPAPYDYTVDLFTFDGTATLADNDYGQIFETLHFSDGSPGPLNRVVLIKGDIKPEPNESFQLKIGNPGPGVEVEAASHATLITLNNDDAIPQLTVADLIHTEGSGGGNGDAHILVTVTNAPIGLPMDIHWHTDNAGAPDPATPGVDYQSVTTIFTLTADTPTETFDLLVPVVRDNTPEIDENFFLIVDSADFGTILSDPQGQVTIDDDDGIAPLPTVLISNAAPVVEGDSGTTLMSFSVTVDGVPANGSTVQFQTQDDTAQGSVDYGITSGILHFGGSNPLTQTVSVPILGDQLEEGDETFFVVLSNASGMTLGASKAKGEITDDDSAQPLPQVSIAGPTLDEGDAGQSTATFVVSLDGPSTAPVTFSWRTVDGTATAASGDYVAVSSGNGFIPAGATQIELPVKVNGDNAVEPDETFNVVMSEVAGGVFTSSQASATVRNDDTPGEFSFSIGDVSVQEGDAGITTATFTVTLSAAHGVVPTVEYSTDSGTATINSDFQPSAGQLVFDEGATSRTITVNVIGDTLAEGDETFTVKLENASGGATIADGSGLGTIVDDDAAALPPVVSVEDAELAEGNAGSAVLAFTVRLDHASDKTVTVGYATADGSATTADSDYQARSGQLSLPPGATSAVIGVPVLGDTRVEADESFNLTLSGPQGATLGRAAAKGTIRNDDAEAPPEERSAIRIARAESAGEGAGSAVVVVERYGDAVGPASARVTVTAGTATAGDDFTPVSADLSWGAGETGGREVRVPLINDNQQEADETLRVVVGELRGAGEGQPLEAFLTVLDDDSPMKLVLIGAAERSATVGSEIELQVKAVREDGVAVAGAVVQFEAVAGPVRIVGEAGARSNAEGIASKRVAVGPAPGTARVRARLAGGDAEASFVLQVEGNLGQAGGGAGGDRNLGDVFDEACRGATGELAEACAYLYGLPPNEQREALAELSPQGVAAQVRAALQAPKNQNRNVGARLDALRGGAPLQTLDQLALSVQGQSLGGVGTLQQSLLRGSVASAPMAGPARRGGSLAPGLDQQIDRDAGWEEVRRRDGDKVELALAKARGHAPLLARQDAAAAAPYDSTESPWGMFVNGRLSFGEAPRRGSDPGYDFDTQGLTAGVDYRVSSNLVVGAALGWVSTGSELADGGAVDTDGISLSLYGTYYRDSWYVEGMAGYGRNDYRFRRSIVLPELFGGRDRLFTEGKPGGGQLSAELGAGYDFRVGEALSLTGFGRFSYVSTSIDGYRESGGGPFGLAFASQDVDSLLGEAGFELTYPWSLRWGVLQPLLRVTYLHEFENDGQLVRARLLGDPGERFFVLRSEQPDSDYLNLAAGISATLPRGWATFLQYDTDLDRAELDIYTLSGGFRFQF